MLLKIYIWLSVFVIFCLILSYNTLVSMVCFFFIILIFCSLLFLLRLEFLAYIILLIYLGGILIFFLFASMLLNPNFSTKRYEINDFYLSIQNWFFLFIFLKVGFFLLNIYEKICILIYENSFVYSPFIFDSSIDNLNNRGLFFGVDSYVFIRLYEDKGILLILIILVLFFVIFGVITLCYKKCPVKI